MAMCRRVACVAAALLLSGCGLPFFDKPPNYGFVQVTAGGTTLAPGQSDVPPTLNLLLHADVAFRAQDVSVKLDGNGLALSRSGADLAATVPPLPLASAHHLDVTIAGRAQGVSLDFTVVAPTAAMLAAHLNPQSAPIVDGAFAEAPTQPTIAAALPGASLTWTDPAHLRATWSGAPPAAIDLPPTVTTARGSHLAAAVHLSLAGLAAGEVRRVTIPAAPAVGGINVVAFVVNSAASNSSLAHHQGVLDWVVATGWVAQPDGSLQGSPDPPSVTRARAARLPVWPSVGNDFTDPNGTSTLLNNPQTTAALVATLTDGAVAGGYAGINLDFEGMAGADQAAFTAFVKTLAHALHAHGLQLMVDVVPHGASGPNHFSAAYDVPAIGAASDVVDVMAYDQHGEGGTPGPVAGLDWTVAELQATLKGLNPAHTLLGVPLYGRGWTNGTGSSFTYAQAITAINDPGARLDYDFAAQTPFIASADGSSLTYFDDADSLARKIALARSRGLEGIAAWRLGFEDPNFWTLFG
jgi:spore germination protein YaaH